MVLGGALGPGFVACDARGAARLCVAGVALGDIHLDITWQAWHKLTSTFVSRGRRGTNSHLPSFCVAGVALMVLGGALGPELSPVALGDIHLDVTWQAWHLVTSTFVSRGRRGTNSHLPSFCVAGVALMVLGGALGPGFVARDARGAAPLCVAGAALGDIHLDITWQAWHKLTSTFVSRGRRGTNSHLPSFSVAGVALMVLGGALGPGFVTCDARGAAPLCVAGLALGDIYLRFTWQAWHKLTSTVVLRGRRGTYGTGWRPWAGIVACGTW